MNRRFFLTTGGLLSASRFMRAAQSRSIKLPERFGLALNIDSSWYFISRYGQKLDNSIVDGFLDQYANTQVRELLFNVNAMRTSYDSKVWDPIWKGYDPDGTIDQPLFASLSAERKEGARKWVDTAWRLYNAGIDPFSRWLPKSRALGISPWVTLRMNDLHYVDDEKAYLHSEYWRNNPQLRRAQYRFDSWADKAFDYAIPAVREHHLKLVREVIDRYDFDGMELDWMRFGYYFKPGHEGEGAEILTQFTAQVRAMLRDGEKKRGHKIDLSARVPSHPEAALGLDMDAARWAREGLIDRLTPAPFLYSEPDIPLELWRQLLAGTKTLLAPGMEVTTHPYPASAVRKAHSLEIARGTAISLLDRGAERLSLFNHFDDPSEMSPDVYHTLLREIGRVDTMAAKPRRHVLTYSDVSAPGQTPLSPQLPAECTSGKWLAFRIPTGPQPTATRAEVRIGVEGAGMGQIAKWKMYLNGERCEWSGAVKPEEPRSDAPMYAFRFAASQLLRGYNLVECEPGDPGRITWVEIAIS